MAASITKRDWEEFRAVGRVPPSLRELVLQSWQRSGRLFVQNVRQAPVLPEPEIASLRAQTRRLRRGARAALDRAGYLLNHTGNILLLCNEHGVVLDVSGDSVTQARGRENHLDLGGNWSEAVMGTNAIGTCAYLRRPVLVSEVEHYCEEIQRWNCAATPITDPATKRLIGVMDISWPRGVDQANAMALSAALALQVEGDLNRQLAVDREALLEKLHLRRLRGGQYPILVMDRGGSDVFATEDFLRFCEDDRALSALREQISGIIDQPPHVIAESLVECLPGTEIEVVSRGEEAIGILLALRRQRTRPADAGAELERIGRIGSEMAVICSQARKLAHTSIPILIEGETGTGKSFLAQAIHRASPQAAEPFETIDCSTLTAAALREDLARESRRGTMIEQMAASGGVLCLDRPGAVPGDAQKLLLSLIEAATDCSREHRLRLLTLSPRSLYKAMQSGEFRADLYYRLAGARLTIPPLRHRPEEIIPSLRIIAERHAASGKRQLRFTSAAMAAMEAYDWPGNLLEMQNLVAMLDALSASGLVDEKMLPPEIRLHRSNSSSESLRDVERAEILDALDQSGGNLTETARRLGIARSTLYLKLDTHRISRPRKG